MVAHRSLVGHTPLPSGRCARQRAVSAEIGVAGGQEWRWLRSPLSASWVGVHPGPAGAGRAERRLRAPCRPRPHRRLFAGRYDPATGPVHDQRERSAVLPGVRRSRSSMSTRTSSSRHGSCTRRISRPRATARRRRVACCSPSQVGSATARAVPRGQKFFVPVDNADDSPPIVGTFPTNDRSRKYIFEPAQVGGQSNDRWHVRRVRCRPTSPVGKTPPLLDGGGTPHGHDRRVPRRDVARASHGPDHGRLLGEGHPRTPPASASSPSTGVQIALDFTYSVTVTP